VNWLFDVFHLLRAKIHKLERDGLSDLSVSIPRDAHASWLSKALQTGCDVDAVPQEITTPDHHVTDVDANAEAQCPFRVNPGVQDGKSLLNIDSTLHGINGRGELGQDAVARRVSDPPPMLPNESVHDLTVGRESLKGADLVLSHETRVPGHIGSEDSRQAPLDPF
jgi:hypothetical protein